MGIPFKLEKALLAEAPSTSGLLGDLAGGAMSLAGSVVGVSGIMAPPWAGRDLHFRFNPDKLTLSKSANFRARSAPSKPTLQVSMVA